MATNLIIFLRINLPNCVQFGLGSAVSSPKQFWHKGTLAAEPLAGSRDTALMGAKPSEAERVLFFDRPVEAANLLYSLYFAPSANHVS